MHRMLCLRMQAVSKGKLWCLNTSTPVEAAGNFNVLIVEMESTIKPAFIKPAHQDLVQGELYLAACWVCPPNGSCCPCVQAGAEAVTPRSRSVTRPGTERGAAADSSPEPSAKTWGCVQHKVQCQP